MPSRETTLGAGPIGAPTLEHSAYDSIAGLRAACFVLKKQHKRFLYLFSKKVLRNALRWSSILIARRNCVWF
jgi:hypothetical protein